MNLEVKEFRNALVTIRGNALRCGNSIYSIHNIVSLTFDSVTKENREPISIQDGYWWAKILLIYFLFSFSLFFILLHIIVDDPFQFHIDLKKILHETVGLNHKNIGIIMDTILTFFATSLFISLFCGVSSFIIAKRAEQNFERYYFVEGLRVVFVNNINLFLVSRADTGFIKETIDNLYFFIATSELDNKKELIINFSDSSINIKEAVGSNIIGGNVQGDVKNGQ